jgi:glutamine synthetase
LPKEEALNIPKVAETLQEALQSLEADHEFLTRGGVFTEDMLRGYIDLKRADVERMNMTTHPVEFELYYSC